MAHVAIGLCSTFASIFNLFQYFNWSICTFEVCLPDAVYYISSILISSIEHRQQLPCCSVKRVTVSKYMHKCIARTHVRATASSMPKIRFTFSNFRKHRSHFSLSLSSAPPSCVCSHMVCLTAPGINTHLVALDFNINTVYAWRRIHLWNIAVCLFGLRGSQMAEWMKSANVEMPMREHTFHKSLFCTGTRHCTPVWCDRRNINIRTMCADRHKPTRLECIRTLYAHVGARFRRAAWFKHARGGSTCRRHLQKKLGENMWQDYISHIYSQSIDMCIHRTFGSFCGVHCKHMCSVAELFQTIMGYLLLLWQVEYLTKHWIVQL